ncbi:MAG: DUF839 domain-containing protein [Xanthomonadales bacterium]|nr:DUF839 domain-containing protein [Xanthomonadales bacterium]
MHRELRDARRNFLRHSAGLGLGVSLPFATLFGLAGCRTRSPQDAVNANASGYGPLRATLDETTGLALLRLPEGFRYRSFGWTGESMHGGVIPFAHDGMGVVSHVGTVCTLIRNHEVIRSTGAIGDVSLQYDAPAAGGCVAFDFDTEHGEASGFRAVLGGTLQNCAGGTTPRGSWLSCEEMTFDPVTGIDDRGAPRPELQQPHGYVFEVYSDGHRAPERIRSMGLFKHEAAVTDPVTGNVYLTEDGRGMSGFYRYEPLDRHRLSAGGALQMLAVKGRPDLRTGVRVGMRFDVRWVPIAKPEQLNLDAGLQGAAVSAQGLALAASGFARLEGCYVHGDTIFFTATSGGDFGHGQIWVYRPREETLSLLFEAKTLEALDYPDNLCVSPRGALLINEDNDRSNPQRMVGMDMDGQCFTFAESNVILNGERGFTGDYRYEEWCGVCFSPDGRWLFANCYAPGFTVAITGPWERGPL